MPYKRNPYTGQMDYYVSSPNTILYGDGAPSSGLGSNGDFYIDTTNTVLYGPKTAGSWGSGVALKGADGEITFAKYAQYELSEIFHEDCEDE